MEVLHTKNLEAHPTTSNSLDLYPYRPPELVSFDIINNMVTPVAGQLSGGAGPVGTDSVSLQYWLLYFGVMSG